MMRQQPAPLHLELFFVVSKCCVVGRFLSDVLLVANIKLPPLECDFRMLHNASNCYMLAKITQWPLECDFRVLQNASNGTMIAKITATTF